MQIFINIIKSGDYSYRLYSYVFNFFISINISTILKQYSSYYTSYSIYNKNVLKVDLSLVFFFSFFITYSST